MKLVPRVSNLHKTFLKLSKKFKLEKVLRLTFLSRFLENYFSDAHFLVLWKRQDLFGERFHSNFF